MRNCDQVDVPGRRKIDLNRATSVADFLMILPGSVEGSFQSFVEPLEVAVQNSRSRMHGCKFLGSFEGSVLNLIRHILKNKEEIVWKSRSFGRKRLRGNKFKFTFLFSTQ